MTNHELKQIRLSMKLTQQQMAELLHCNVRTYQAYEYGQYKVPELVADFLKHVRSKRIDK